ncbi:MULTISPECIES: respiratory chain complex I subunit 1 family protein [unclassified Adlercreutzia]|uniref:respiratory chain complex I subunit 1 family protein n=1 Tax=unclassified Adlercreutzia TaxID=2636013 RepID=UPI00197F99FE|nr:MULTISPECIES: NADH-quinone oxidoreductase subunit H [unclassified Adlercreutzia]
MIEFTVAVIQVLLLVLLAPLASGVARKIRAKMHTRQGTSIFQDYYDLAKLWRRCEVQPGGAGLVSRAMPPVFLGTMVIVAAGLPLIARACPVPLLGDVITVLYLMALPRFMFSLAALDSAGSYTAVGGVRELLLGVLVEPALILTLMVLALACGSTNLGVMADSVASLVAYPPVAVVVAGVAFACACYVEMGKLPFDVAEAEQELQEGPLAEFSGPSLAMLKLGMSVKQLVVASLFVAVFLPFGAASVATPLGLAVGLALFVAKLAAVLLVAAVIENAVMRVRYQFLGRYTWFVFGLAALSFVFLVIGI